MRDSMLRVRERDVRQSGDFGKRRRLRLSIEADGSTPGVCAAHGADKMTTKSAAVRFIVAAL